MKQKESCFEQFVKAFNYGFGAVCGITVGIYAVFLWHALLFIIHDLTH